MDYIVHQCWEKFLYSINTSGKCTILSIIVYGLSRIFGLFRPFPGYRVYNVEHTKLVGARSLSKMGVEFLDEDRFGLRMIDVSILQER